MVQINLKLNLRKIKYIIKVSYNTFEKATYDQYLVSSLALRSYDKNSAYQYIDDITGAGSLNAHFKQLYDKARKLDNKQLENIMNNSMYPMLKIDKSNSYEYYPELDISIFNKKLYKGDLGKYENLIDMLYIREEVIEMELIEKINDAIPEPYIIKIEGEKILVKIAEEWVILPTEIFQEIFENDEPNLEKFQGEIHNEADGIGWSKLTDAVINNMYANNNYFYNNGNHCLIRNDNIRKTIISQLVGFYIYKEEIIQYVGNRDLCNKVLNILLENKSINEFKTKSLITLLTYADDLLAQRVINYILVRKDSKELALMGVSLLNKGIEKKWEEEALKSFMLHSDSSRYNAIYKANPELVTDIQVLSMINPDYLIPKHKEEIEKYKKDRQLKIDNIRSMVGEVTTSGMREEAKKLKANEQTKRFSKLANKYIGHSKINFEKSTQSELDKYLRDISEMYDLMKQLKSQLDKGK